MTTTENTDHAAGMVGLSPAARELILALADDELCIGQRHSSWIGIAPFLEEDLAFISIAQDELSHARALYRLVATDGAGDASEGDMEIEREIDRLAMGRPFDQYRSCWFAEDACTEWADALVRHVLYDEAETLRWQALRHSSLPALASLAERVLVEEVYHRRHGTTLLVRLLRGTQESRRCIEASLGRLAPLAATMFEPTQGEEQALREGITRVGAAELAGQWQALVAELLGRGGVAPLESDTLDTSDAIPPNHSVWYAGEQSDAGGPRLSVGRQGRRSPGFQDLYEEMTAVYALDPAASW